MTNTGLRNRVAIIGVGESTIGKVPHMTGLGLNAQAAKRALDETGLKPSDIDGLLTAYSMTEPYFMLGSVMCEYLGLKPTFNASMVVGGASPAIMLKHAAEAIVSGQAEIILCCAGENRATGQTRDQAVAALAAVGHPYYEQPYGTSIPSFYAMITRRHMHEYGTTREQLAQMAVISRDHAVRHPNAHMTQPITVEEVINSKPIAEPLNILDCCLISDAGGAYIVTTAERAKDLKSDPVYLLGIGEYHTHEHLMCADSLTEFGALESGRRAYTMAGLGPEDINFAELREGFLQYLPIGALIGIILLAELILVVGSWIAIPEALAVAGAPIPPPEKVSNTLALGQLIYTQYIYFFQSAGLILLVAMVGAIVLTLRQRPGVRKQKISDQLARRREDSVEVVKVEPGSGI